jgi:hypothetical protein
MQDKIRLSHSQIEKFNLCSERWRLHYQEGYRTQSIGSALFFGTSYGNAVQEMAKEGLALEEAKNRFDKYFKETELNGVKIDLENTDKARYFKGDLKIEYVPIEVLNTVDQKILENLDEVFKLQGEGKLHYDYQRDLNKLAWHSMRYKGHRLIESFYEKILPRIKKVYSIEEPINLETNDGSAHLVGFIDLICDFEMDDGSIEKVLFDNKTSASPYSKNAIIDKQQLTIYEYAKNIGKVGYIVGIKNTFKMQVLIGEIPQDVQDKYITIIDETLHKIKNKEFEKNPKSCRAFGQLCEFYDICFKNDDSKLIKK